MQPDLGIETLRLNLPFRLNHVNVFYAEGENGWTIIDAGLHNEETVAAWDPILKNKHVDHIFVTHYHPDHYGYAGAMQERTGARVHMTETDAKAGAHAWTKEFLQDMRAYYDYAGIPDEVADDMRANTESFIPRVKPLPRIDHYFQEGEKVQIGKLEYEIIFTPGHSDGLIVFFNQENSVLLATDHLLPKITPNISYWFHGDENPLKTYLQSLEKIEYLDAHYVIPSHGKPFEGANGRIKEIRDHHTERLETLHGYLDEPATVYEICQKLFPKVLTVHETRFAIGETLAHLEYLRYEGNCKREAGGGVWYYSL
ncbi:MBL fold metallo-hydrolase [Natribacillus halophilus]|uniref:Glyoxylase, beta-lactamase superfamily II n=1 Tax=Natribacillus halophilus TaxID=549003 RepID=A0A1G8KH71_9BACI|nr:MBL fold metallo-hydrolase [Natribacillus halophilus]SDI42752.1 Glyoxylase, beta-lactamase superfamily II [Natribacillus halophilus]